MSSSADGDSGSTVRWMCHLRSPSPPAMAGTAREMTCRPVLTVTVRGRMCRRIPAGATTAPAAATVATIAATMMDTSSTARTWWIPRWGPRAQGCGCVVWHCIGAQGRCLTVSETVECWRLTHRRTVVLGWTIAVRQLDLRAGKPGSMEAYYSSIGDVKLRMDSGLAAGPWHVKCYGLSHQYRGKRGHSSIGQMLKYSTSRCLVVRLHQ